jgi:hypothetical protein
MSSLLSPARAWRAALAGIAMLSFSVALQAQMQMNIEQLVEFVRSELALKQGNYDKQTAAYIKKVQLTEKLTDKTILDLEAQGAGPRTVQALQELRDETVAKKAPTQDVTYSPATAPDTTLSRGPGVARMGTTSGPVIPAPDSVRQQKIIELMKQYALSYTQNLPNFICVEVMRRYIDPNAGDHYRSLGNVLAKVSYNEGQENYQVYSVNGHYEDTTLDKAGASGGAISSGEFGSLMREIFEPHSEAEFGWDHWATLRGRRMAVFNYMIDSGHSAWSITYSAGPGDEQRIITAYKGLVYADENTGEITRIKFVAVDIPRTFPVSQATEILDYDQVQISGQPYICPLMATLNMTAGREKTKNEIEFRDYRKYGVESGVTYDMKADMKEPPPLPASKTEEQPATGSAPAPANASRPASTASAKKATSSGSAWQMPTPPPPPLQQ